jgi:hypothetical protein
MPIFSNRSIFRALNNITPVLGDVRARDLTKRLEIGGEPAIAAEWEIIAIDALATAGQIALPPHRPHDSDLDIIYTSRATGESASIEITSVSDSSLHDRNPVETFQSRILAMTFENELHSHGGIYYQIGDIKTDRGPILGVPARQQMDAFFASVEISSFIRDIKAAPHNSHTYAFEARGARSSLTYKPGRYGGGGYASYRKMIDPAKNHLVSRLKKKDAQIRKAGLELPSIVVLCDGDCDALHSTMPTLLNPSAEKVINLFLNGEPHIRRGPWYVRDGAKSQTRRINAVVMLSIQEIGHVLDRRTLRRRPVVRFVSNRSTTHYGMNESLAAEVTAAVSHLPPIARMPQNANRSNKWPKFYGGFSMAFKNNGDATVKISLLSLQRMLGGEIPYEKFIADHKDAINQIRRQNAAGKMIGSVAIDPQTDDDDDWITFAFTEQAPDRLFAKSS